MARVDQLKARRTDPAVLTASLTEDVLRKIHQSDAVTYVVGTMQPIDPEYTKNTYLQGDRVCNQLGNRLSTTCEYEYQGSVTNDTHIKARSDIDALVILGQYYSLQSPQQPTSPYKGDPIQDLTSLRQDAVRCLKAAFPEVTVDDSGSKAISLSGGSLTRKIDVVPANWYHTVTYSETRNPIYRGVEILDLDNKKRISNTPFLHNWLVDQRDQSVNGGLRKVARLIKSLKYDTGNIGLSSYDLVALAYRMPDAALQSYRGMDLTLLSTCLEFCRTVASNESVRMSLKVPDEHRLIFASGHATLTGLNNLIKELERLAHDVLTENARSFKRLEEARVEW